MASPTLQQFLLLISKSIWEGTSASLQAEMVKSVA